jgi:CRP-like cAMP-binding protein
MQGAKLMTFQRNDVIVAEGTNFQRIWQVESGVCRIEKNSLTKPLGRIEAGQMFGEISFLLSGGATASVIADSETVTCYVIEGYFINIMFNVRPQIAGRFYKYLAKTVQRTLRERDNVVTEKNNLATTTVTESEIHRHHLHSQQPSTISDATTSSDSSTTSPPPTPPLIQSTDTSTQLAEKS